MLVDKEPRLQFSCCKKNTHHKESKARWNPNRYYMVTRHVLKICLDFKERGTTKDAMKQQEYITQAHKQESCFLISVMFLNNKIKLHKN